MSSVVFAGYTGLTVKDVTELRHQLRSEGVEIVMAKKTLLRRALTEAKLDAGIVDNLTGEVALAFGTTDEVLPAKLIRAFARTHDKLVFKGAVVGGDWLDAAKVMALSKLPGRTELRTQLVWTLAAPMSGLLNVMSGNIRGLVRVLNAQREKLATA